MGYKVKHCPTNLICWLSPSNMESYLVLPIGIDPNPKSTNPIVGCI